MTAKQILDAAITTMRKLAGPCPQWVVQEAFGDKWESCEELDDQGHYDETDGRCSPDRERECWRQYLCEEAQK